MSTTTLPSLSEFVELTRRFSIYGEAVAAAHHGSGHINDTFAVTVSQAGTAVRYIFQRINHRIFTDVPALMDNILRVTSHQQARLTATGGGDASRRSLTVIPGRDGRPYVRDDGGAWWRAYLFIEQALTYDKIESAAQARTAAQAFGEFQRLLADLPGGRLSETIPAFHHTPRRYATFDAAAQADVVGRAAGCAEDVAFARSKEPLARTLTDLLDAGLVPERVTHNDTKLNNVMLDDVTGAGVCVIDLDTVMPGLSLYDFGDMVRSATNAAAEDETDLTQVVARPEIFAALAEGFLAGAGAALNDVERAHLVVAGQVITYEIGLRFLTDHLQGDVYFKIKRPGHNLDRARNQFALVRSLEAQSAAFEKIVSALSQ
ncbi:aminoglycoside phosphotransferase family protein [Rariglobus hedericola]|uniref:Aminoglycoside phosphotransferase family protein n=1 Tax=Rariglobus hedericola TaxID=2597822 RepID=A0A556QSH5_9BACT|nr:aminoglycoside phosphotransferase family protein [Rariglobus hedericola]TSJ79597.1 aminoglycoside phosphotransferase family protein [Rariglobus hedericola]